MSLIDEKSLKEKKLEELRNLAKTLGIIGISKYKKDELILEILEKTKNEMQNDREESEEVETENRKENIPIKVLGILDLHSDGYGFLRSNGYNSGEEDIYVPPAQVKRFRLKTGDMIEGLSREKRDKEKFKPLIYVNSVNGLGLEKIRGRRNFEDLTPIYPIEKIVLEYDGSNISSRIIDLICPLGKGQRGLIVSPPKAGKTTLLKSIAQSVSKKYPEIEVIVLLIDERPEEVTDMKRSVKGEVIASTFDELPQNHIRVAEIVLERAKRLVETGKDVVLLMDSITRLSRAYNITSPSSGKTLSGGLDPLALNRPKRFFGAARKIEEGGSLTILATALVDTGSRMDDVIFEEFKGTGNMEVNLDRKLSELRIFPAIDIYKSGTRREELLQSKEELKAMVKIRKALSDSDTAEQSDKILKMLLSTKNNKEFVNMINN